MKNVIFGILVAVLALSACQAQSVAKGTELATVPLELGTPCPTTLTDMAELEGREFQVNVVDGEYPTSVCLMDLATNITYTVNGFVKYIGYEVDSHGLTVQVDDAWVMPGQKGKLVFSFDSHSEFGDRKYYNLVSTETFEKVYGTPQDLAFLKVWTVFRQDVINRYGGIVSMPSWMEYTKFDADFTPAIGCWVSQAYIGAVKIADEFAFCQDENRYGSNNVSSYMFIGDQPEISSLIAVLPQNGDAPTVLTPGQVQGDLKFVGCFPVEGSTPIDPLWVTDGRDMSYFFHYEGVAYTGPAYSETIFPVAPVGVIFEYKGMRAGDVIPLRVTFEYSAWVDHNYGVWLFTLPESCNFSN